MKKELIFIMVLMISISFATNYCVGDTTNFTCGDTITESCIMNGSVSCSGTGFTLGANNIIVDGNGYTLDGHDNGETVGVYNTGYNNITIKNFTIEKFGKGIYFENSNASFILNNNLTFNGYIEPEEDPPPEDPPPEDPPPEDPPEGTGIHLVNTNYTIIQDNIIQFDEGTGVYIYYSSFNNLINNSVIENNIMGVNIYFSSYNNLSNNYVRGNEDCGVYIYYSSFNNLTNNEISLNHYGGILFADSPNNIAFNNSVLNNDYFGVYVFALLSKENEIYNNTIFNNTKGVHLNSYPTENTISNNNITNNLIGVDLSSYANNNTLNNNILYNNTDGIKINTNCINNIINNTRACSNTNTDLYDNSYPNNIWTNSIYDTSDPTNITYFDRIFWCNDTPFTPPPINITLTYPENEAVIDTNSTTLNYTVNIEANCSIYHNISGEWATDCETNETSGASCGVGPMANGDYIWNVYCEESANASNNAWGAEANWTFTINYTAPYTGCVNLSDEDTYQDKVTGNMTAGFTVNDSITLCEDTYTFVDVTALTINASDITVDCNGSTLQGNDALSGHGIYNLLYDHVTIQNCIINDFNVGINFEPGEPALADYGTLLNNTLTSNRNFGIYLSSSSNNILTNNTANNNLVGIQSQSNFNNTLTNNTANNNTDHGILLSSSSNNTLTSNTANNNTDYGIYLLFSSNNTLTNNTASSNLVGIYFHLSCNNNILTNNIFTENNQHGVSITSDSTDNNFITTYSCSNNQSGGDYYDIIDATSPSANIFSSSIYTTSDPDNTTYLDQIDTCPVPPTPINITLTYPEDLAVIDTNETTLNYTVNIESFCGVYTNITGEWNRTCDQDNVEGNQSCSVGPLSNGDYIWNVYCEDVTNSSNNGWAEETNRTFTINYTAPCIEDLQNTSWSEWEDQECINTTHRNQSRSRIEYDANTCGTFENVTHTEYQSVEDETCAEACIEDLQNTSWSAWANITECRINNTILQERTKIEYDANDCGTFENVTHTENQEIECNYCTENITGPFNTTCNSSNLLTQYYIDTNYETCCVVTGFENDCSILNDTYQNQTFNCIYISPRTSGTSGGGGAPVKQPIKNESEEKIEDISEEELEDIEEELIADDPIIEDKKLYITIICTQVEDMITCFVTDENGNPYINEEIDMMDPNNNIFIYITDENGKFSYLASEAGRYSYSSKDHGSIGFSSINILESEEVEEIEIKEEDSNVLLVVTIAIVFLFMSYIWLIGRKKRRRGLLRL